MLIGGLVKLLPAPGIEKDRDTEGCYDQLIHGVFESESGDATVVAIASASKGAGTNYIANDIAGELSRFSGKKTAIVDARQLETISISDLEKWAKLCLASDTGVSWLKEEGKPAGNNKFNLKKRVSTWQSDRAFRRNCLQLLRKYFDYVLIQCHPVNRSTPLILLAELVDGVIVVAAAGETRRDEIQRLERHVEMAHGKVIGFILNKREYPIPQWLYEKI